MATTATKAAASGTSKTIRNSDSGTSQSTAETRLNELRLKLSNSLQSSLDIDATLETFFKQAQSMTRCDGMRFKHQRQSVQKLFGVSAANCASYNVKAGKDNLGELVFMRENKFAEAELTMLEMLMGLLFYPLRNALQYQEALKYSFIDSLTNIGNRLAFDHALAREMKLAKRHKKALAMLLIDADKFKNINDRHGHLAGDEVLKRVAATLKNTLRETDQVFRYGGEEFIAILSETDLDNAILSAERIRRSVSKSAISIDDKSISVTVSVGVSSLAPDDLPEDLFERADKALYAAKNGGRNRTVSSVIDREREIKKLRKKRQPRLPNWCKFFGGNLQKTTQSFAAQRRLRFPEQGKL